MYQQIPQISRSSLPSEVEKFGWRSPRHLLRSRDPGPVRRLPCKIYTNQAGRCFHGRRGKPQGTGVTTKGPTLRHPEGCIRMQTYNYISFKIYIYISLSLSPSLDIYLPAYLHVLMRVSRSIYQAIWPSF